MPPEPTRVLLVDDEGALLFSVCDYLTFRGCSVDCVEEMAEARALVHHLHYDAVVICVRDAGVERAVALAQDVRRLAPEAQLIALTSDLASLADERGDPIHFDQVLGRHLPIDQLARHLCRCIAA